MQLNFIFIALFVTVTLARFECELDSPPPANEVCGESGSATEPAERTLTVPLNQCQRLVRGVAIAIYGSFSYNSATSLCSIYRYSTSISGFQPSDTETKFYERDCFTCSFSCPDDLDYNVVVNGGFEAANTTSLFPWGDYSNQTPVEGGLNSDYAAQCVLPGGTPGSCGLGSNLFTCSSQQYILSWSDRVTESDGLGTLSTIAAGADTYVEYAENITTTGWRKHSLAFSNLGLYNSRSQPVALSYGAYPGDKTLQVDNIRAHAIPFPLATRKTPSLLSNGGFEANGGSLSPWRLYTTGAAKNTTGVVVGGKTSKHALGFYPQNNSSEKAAANLVQHVKTTVGKTYVISFDYQQNNASGKYNYGTIQVEASDRYRTTVFSYFLPEHKSGGWFRFERYVRADGKSLTLSLLITRTAGFEFARVDNIAFTEATINL